MARIVRGKDYPLQISWLDSMRARREVRDLLQRYELNDIDDTSELVAYVETATGTPIRIKPLPSELPLQVTGLVRVTKADTAFIYLPRERGVYPAHCLHHEIGHLLMWHKAALDGRDDPTPLLACSDDYVEHVVEMLAQHLSARLLRIRTPHIERILG